jgi:UDP:flavonoid glycosyltransferase YjiC (YdhE family)
VARILITSWGSYGDVYPYIGLGRALAERGHNIALAVPGYYAPLVEAAGLEHRPVGPAIDPADREIVARVMHPIRGAEVLIREWLMPKLAETFAELDAAVSDADLLVTHPVTFAAPIVAELRRLPWVATVLAPMSFFSINDAPVLPPAPRLAHLRRFGSFYGRLTRWMADRSTRSWIEAVARLRAAHGLGSGGHPLLDGQFSPHLNLALFSRVLGAPQSDWPVRTTQTGFVFYNGSDAVPADAEEFLSNGPAPVVFTLGSSAVGAAGRFYEESAAAVERLGVRALLMTGGFQENERVATSGRLITVPFAPHQEVFPRASVIVHHGGVGTTGQGLRSGRPTLVVPHAHDQADNADRLTRLGVARTLPPEAYEASAVARELERLLQDRSYGERAAGAARVVSDERGAVAAAEAIERLVS